MIKAEVDQFNDLVKGKSHPSMEINPQKRKKRKIERNEVIKKDDHRTLGKLEEGEKSHGI